MSQYFPEASECGHHTVFGSVPIVTCAGDHLQLSYVDMAPHQVIDWHSHENEQMGLVIAGSAVFSIGDEEKHLKAGDFFRIPGGVRHRVVTGDEPLQALDAFYPIRDEYR